MMIMKLKVKITGPKVHDVGYRVFLLKHAMNMALPGLSTYNWEEDGQQEVIALVEGDEARIKAFLKMIEKNKPEMAAATKVTSEPYDGDVGRTSEVAMFCTFVQLDKAIPLLLKIQDNTAVTPQILNEIKAVRKTTNATFEEIKDLFGTGTDKNMDWRVGFKAPNRAADPGHWSYRLEHSLSSTIILVVHLVTISASSLFRTGLARKSLIPA